MSVSVDPYSGARAQNYHIHHSKSVRTRITTRREKYILKNLLRSVARIDRVADVPCGSGRFWPVFESLGVQTLIAGDASDNMLEVAGAHAPAIRCFDCRKLDLFDLDLPDNSVDAISCMRFLHHLSREQDRRVALHELYRTTNKYVVVSLWVDGNLQSSRRKIKTEKPVVPGFGPRRCFPREQIEGEFVDAGFRIGRSVSVWPGLSMWRFYLLEKI